MKKMMPRVFAASYINFYREHLQLDDEELCRISGIDSDHLKSMELSSSDEDANADDFIFVDSALYDKITLIGDFELSLAEAHDRYFKKHELSEVIGVLEKEGHNLVVLLKSGSMRLMQRAYNDIQSVVAD